MQQKSELGEPFVVLVIVVAAAAAASAVGAIVPVQWHPQLGLVDSFQPTISMKNQQAGANFANGTANNGCNKKVRGRTRMYLFALNKLK